MAITPIRNNNKVFTLSAFSKLVELVTKANPHLADVKWEDFEFHYKCVVEKVVQVFDDEGQPTETIVTPSKTTITLRLRDNHEIRRKYKDPDFNVVFDNFRAPRRIEVYKKLLDNIQPSYDYNDVNAVQHQLDALNIGTNSEDIVVNTEMYQKVEDIDNNNRKLSINALEAGHDVVEHVFTKYEDNFVFDLCDYSNAVDPIVFMFTREEVEDKLDNPDITNRDISLNHEDIVTDNPDHKPAEVEEVPREVVMDEEP